MEIDFSPLVNNWRFLVPGLLTTLLLCVLSIVLGLVLGTAVGIGRSYGGRLTNLILGFYVDTMRAVPVLAVLVWTYFAFPVLIGQSLTPLEAGVFAFGIHLAAYVAETIRAGLASVRTGQMRAALSLGMSKLQAIRTVILPQAVIRMLPPLGSLIVIAIKDSAIASVIAVPELMRQSQVLAGKTYRPFEIYTFAMLVYFVLCYPVAYLVNRLYRRVAPLGAS